MSSSHRGRAGHSPLIARLFHAVIALKRLVKIRRNLMKKRGLLPHTIKSAFFNEIHKSHRNVKYASFGRVVVDIDGDKMKKFRSEEQEIQNIEKAKKIEKNEKMSKRRAGGIGLITELSNGLARVERGSVADRIRALKTNYPVETTQRELNLKKFKMMGGIKETTTKDVSHILQKNVHIAMNQVKNQDASRTNKIRNNLKLMKKMNVQEVLNYAAGTAVYFGATVAFQSRHGGYLSYNNNADIKASAPKIVPSARFVVWNSDDLNDHGIMRYGDALWLQAGVHEVLGAQFGGGVISADGTRKLKPSLINCRRENAFKAQQYGRWIVLNRENPSETLGDQVLHHDKIMLEQEWCYLASHTPYDSFMEKSHSFEDSEKGGNDFFKPTEECIWRLHLVTLPSDDNADARFREYLLDQAKEQIKISAQDRRIKERVLSGPLSRRISDNLKPEEVVKRHLPQANSADATKKHLLKKFDRQKANDFAKNGPSVSSLKLIYGPHSVVYKNARAAEAVRREKNSKESDFHKTEAERTQEAVGPKMSLQETEDLYWDIAQNVLTDTRAWESLPSAMEVYQDLDQSRKEIAIRIIQKFAKNKLSTMFSWKRVMKSIDVKETHKLSNSLLYQASQPVKKPALLGDEDGTEDDATTSGNEKDDTFMTSAPPDSYRRLSSAETDGKFARRVSKAGLGEISPELARLQQVLHVEAEEVEEEEKHVARKHFSDRQGSKDYFYSTVDIHRPNTAPVPEFQQEAEMDAQELKNMSRHQRRTMLTSASASSIYAVKAARNMLKGPSSANLSSATKERPQSAEIKLNFPSDDDEREEIEVDFDKTGDSDENRDEDGDVQRSSSSKIKPPDDPTTHRILGRFEPKKQSKREKFNRIIRSMSRAQDPNSGLPQDVFDDPHYDVSVSTSLSFLRASSSTPQIYSDVKTKKRREKYKVTTKVKRKI